MKRYILFIIVIVCLISCTRKVVDNYIYTYYPNGSVKEKFIIRDSLFEDTSFYYYQNGRLLNKKIWQHGLLNGKATWYFTNGQIKAEGIFRDSLKTGEWYYYDSLGQLEAMKEYFIVENKSNANNRFREVSDSNKYAIKGFDYDVISKISKIDQGDTLFDFNINVKYQVYTKNVRVIYGKLGNDFSDYSKADTVYSADNRSFHISNVDAKDLKNLKGILQCYKDTIWPDKRHVIDMVNSYFLFKNRIGWTLPNKKNI